MSDNVDGSGSENSGSDAVRTNPSGHAPGHSIQPVPAPPPDRRKEREAHITFLRSRAAVARAEVDAIAALHQDPDTLEELLSSATPEEVALAEAVEHRISERVVAARQVADAAEADYERALLDDSDDGSD